MKNILNLSSDMMHYKNLHKLYGILNGIDDVEYNPKTDPFIEAQYDSRNVQQGKAKNTRRDSRVL